MPATDTPTQDQLDESGLRTLALVAHVMQTRNMDRTEAVAWVAANMPATVEQVADMLCRGALAAAARMRNEP
jgi:hypothetical protein